MQITDPGEAVRLLFDDVAPRLRELTGEQIELYRRDWAGGEDLQLYTGSRQYVESLILPFFETLRWKLKFEGFVIELEERWQCAFVKTFYSGMVNFLLVWRSMDGFSVTATGYFPAR